MKFYDCSTAPSPRRVRIFIAEKGISVPTVQVDLRNNEQFSPAFRAINPEATVPVLELDNGTRIADAIGICVYFEATHPQPPLMGEKNTQMPIASVMRVPLSSSSTGTVASGLMARNAGLNCSLLRRSTCTVGTLMPFSARKIRTRRGLGAVLQS